MIHAGKIIHRAAMPVGVLLGVFAVHFLWLGIFPEQDPAQSRWVSAERARASWLVRYVEGGNYWLGLSYSLSLGFAAVALRRYREGRFCTARNLAIGGVTFSGVLSVVGCYLLGCCGSPMLAVYLSLFGAAFVPLAKPLVAVVTLLFITLGWLWMNRHAPAVFNLANSECDDPGCQCEPNRVAEGEIHMPTRS